MNRAIPLVLLALLVVPLAGAANLEAWSGPGGGAVVRSANTTETAGYVFATSYTVNAGVIISLSTARTELTIVATDFIDIAGTINGNGLGQGAAGLGNTGASALGGGGVGSTASTGSAGGSEAIAANIPGFIAQSSASVPISTATMRGASGGGGATATGAVNVRGGAGGAGGFCAAGGAGGAGGNIVITGGTGGVAGAGGAGIWLIAPVIYVRSTGTIQADGNPGASATGSTPNGSSGGGGGSGGVIHLVTRYLVEEAGSSIHANGGVGGAGGGSGGPGAAGGAGGTTGCNPGSDGSSPTDGGGGGGGGAAGMVFRRVDGGMNWDGTWSGTATYSPGDSVTYNGLSYVALTTHTNQQPDTNADDWTLMGNSGFNSITVNVAEPPGANCAAGGRKITNGLDNGDGGGTPRDGTLQSGEVDSTAYVCDGATGPQGDPGPIGITWQGQWDDDITYMERDAVHYAGSAWFCFVATCDDAPSPGSLEWDFIANADGNVVFSTADNFSSLGIDGFLFLLFWVAAILFFIYRDWAFSLAFALPGLLDTLWPDQIPGDFPEYLLFCLLGVVMQYFAGDKQKFSLHGRKKKSGVMS